MVHSLDTIVSLEKTDIGSNGLKFGSFILLSGQYLKGDLGQMFGRLPPSFLPVNGKRLIEHQLKVSPPKFRKFVSLPQDFKVSPLDLLYLQSSSVEILRTKQASLEGAVKEILDFIGRNFPNEPLELLYGDTMAEPLDSNCIGVVKEPIFYDWGQIGRIGNESKYVFAGRIRIEQPKILWEKIDKGIDLTSCIRQLVNEKKLSPTELTMWSDFGNTKTFFESKRKIVESRYFNTIQVNKNVVTKISRQNSEKIKKESLWLESVPRKLRSYFPAVLENTDTSYTIEFISDPSLHEIFVYGKLNLSQWRLIFQRIAEFLHDSCVVLPVEINLQEVSREFTQLLTGKTLKRISEYSEDLFGTNSKFGAIDKDYLYKSYAENLAKISKVQVAGFQHGDLVLSNIFWDFRRETLKFIDPRATNSAGNLNLWGDLRYDLAKLFQSMFLGYELVIADRFALNSGMNKAMFEAFGEYEFIVNLLMIYNEEICIPLGVSLGEISAIANLLVIGLVPLHVDRPDRQKKFLEIIKNQKKWSEEFSN